VRGRREAILAPVKRALWVGVNGIHASARLDASFLQRIYYVGIGVIPGGILSSQQGTHVQVRRDRLALALILVLLDKEGALLEAL